MSTKKKIEYLQKPFIIHKAFSKTNKSDRFDKKL